MPEKLEKYIAQARGDLVLVLAKDLNQAQELAAHFFGVDVVNVHRVSCLSYLTCIAPPDVATYRKINYETFLGGQ